MLRFVSTQSSSMPRPAHACCLPNIHGLVHIRCLMFWPRLDPRGDLVFGGVCKSSCSEKWKIVKNTALGHLFVIHHDFTRSRQTVKLLPHAGHVTGPHTDLQLNARNLPMLWYKNGIEQPNLVHFCIDFPQQVKPIVAETSLEKPDRCHATSLQ